VCVCETERETERQRQRQRDRETERQRETERYTHREDVVRLTCALNAAQHGLDVIARRLHKMSQQLAADRSGYE
jgi:hypothetical protein